VPLYEYQCKQCQHRFEKIQSFSAPEEKVCPECGGEVEKLISAPAIQFKGAGWYVNDYAGRNKAPSPAGSDSSKDGGKESTSKDGGGKDVAAKSSESSSKSESGRSEGGKSDSGSKSDSGASSSNAGSSAASSSSPGSNTKSSN
jgi:putative FmdB family regulatory protein